MKKILIIGASGFLGKYFIKSFKKKYILYYTKYKNIIPGVPLNRIYQLKKNLPKIINACRPDIIIHSAALTDLEKCETKKKKCHKNNYLLSKLVVNLCNKKKIKLIYISTDNFYNNKKKSKESDVVKPVNCYASCKLKSEKFIIKKITNYLIIRTNFFGYSRTKSLFNFIYQNLKNDKKIYMYRNLYFNPIYAPILVKIIDKLITKKITGTFNIGSHEVISKWQFAKKVAFVFKLNSKNIIKKNYRNFLIKRNYNTSMDIKKILKIIKNIKISSLSYQLKLLKKDLKNELKKL